MSEKKQRVDLSKRRVIGLVLILLLTTLVVGMLVRASLRGISLASYPLSPAPVTPFLGGVFEASGVAHVPHQRSALC